MTKTKSLGTQLQMGDGAATEVFTKIIQLTSIGGLETLTEITDVTAHDVASGGYREHIGNGLRSYSDIAFEGFWDEAAATHDDTTGLRSKADSDGPHNWKIIFADVGTTTASFAATLTASGVGEAPLDGALPISGTLKITSEITWS